MDIKQIIQKLQQISVLLELNGENAFRVRAYQRAIRALESQEQTIEELIKQKKLTQIAGIGNKLAETIEEIYHGKTPELLQELQEKIPEGWLEMMKIPGLGAKKIRHLYEHLSITHIDELQKACQEGKVQQLSGFGKKTEQNILKGIESVHAYSGVYHFAKALECAQEIKSLLQGQAKKLLKQLEIAGSLRRKKELVRDIDFVAVATDATKLMKVFVKLKPVSRVINHGTTKSSVIWSNGIQVDLRVVSKEQFPFALMHFTGSKEHNTQLRQEAKKYSWKLNEYGLFQKNNQLIACAREEEIYQQLKLAYIPAELREAYGEVEAAEQNQLPELVMPEDIQGVLHLHTHYSDGKNSLKEMAMAAKERGWHYLGVTDHSRTLTIASGLPIEKVLQQAEEIEKLNQELAPFRIFHGIESDILNDGSLDYPEEILAKFDFIIASIHSNFKISQAQMTKRVLTALDNPYTTILGHPTGRLLLQREPYQIDLYQVIDKAAQNGVAIEINGQPTRLDLDWRWGKYARDKGLLTCATPDAHNIYELDYTHYAVYIAQKAWFEKSRVINSFSTQELEDFFCNKVEGKQ